MCEFKMDFFDNGDPEEFILFQQNYKKSLDTSGTMTAKAKNQYLHTLPFGKALREFETICVYIRNTTITYLNQTLLGLGTYFLLLAPCLRKSA